MTVALLQELRDHVDAGRRGEAIEMIDDVLESFEGDRATAGRDDVRATAVRYGSRTESDPATAADTYLQTATEVDQARIELTEALIGYLAEETGPKVVVQRIDAVLEAYDALDSDRAALAEHADDASLGVVLSLSEIDVPRVPYGGSIGVGTTLSNLGDATESDVALATSDAEGLSASLSPAAIDVLGPDDEETVGVSLTGGSTGEGRLRITAEGEAGGDAIEVTTEVLDKMDYIRRVLEIAERLLSDAEKRLEDHEESDEFTGLLQQGRTWFDRIDQRVESGRLDEERLDRSIPGGIDWLERIRGNLQQHEIPDLDPAVKTEYLSLLEKAIELLEESRKAEM